MYPSSLRCFLPTHAALILILQMFDVSCIPFRTHGNGTAKFSLDALAEQGRLGFALWPATPFEIPLSYEHTDLTILNVDRAETKPPIDVSRLQDFLQDFAANIEHEYPVPSYVPRLAGQSIIDVSSSTKWIIELKSVFLGARLPAQLALTALTRIESLLHHHGPASMNFLVKDANTVYTRGLIIIQNIGELTANSSSSSASLGQTIDRTLSVTYKSIRKN